MADGAVTAGPAAWEQLAPLLFDDRRWAEAPAEVDGLVALAGLEPGATVLDLCCGPGRHTVELARRGYRVTGVDFSAVLLEQARAAAATHGLDPELVCADMAGFVRPDAFDAVASLSTSFGWADTAAGDLAVLAHALTSLRPGGVLVIELLSDEVLTRLGTDPVRAEQDGVVLVAQRRRRPDGWAEHHLALHTAGAGQLFVLAHRVYSAPQLADALTRSGFSDIALFGGLDGSPFDERAARLVAVARRPG